jgi:hypothetical protein
MDPNRQQRFAENVKDNINRGIGGYAFKEKGYSYPTHEEMNQFKKYNIPFDVDEKLRKPVIALNQCGYRTWGSCSGHVAGGERGFISVAPHPVSDPVYNEFKRKDPERYNKLYQYFKKDAGYSSIPVNPGYIKSIIKRYTNTQQVYYKPPVNLENFKRPGTPYHAFTFPSLANRWG